MSRVGLAAAIFFVAVTATSTLAQAQATTPTEEQQRECERSGGYWVTAAGYCKIGA